MNIEKYLFLALFGSGALLIGVVVGGGAVSNYEVFTGSIIGAVCLVVGFLGVMRPKKTESTES